MFHLLIIEIDISGVQRIHRDREDKNLGKFGATLNPTLLKRFQTCFRMV